jgi:hypothetical protein
MLTNAQLGILKTAIASDPALAAQPMNSDGNFAIAVAMNILANPVFKVWKTLVTLPEVGDNTVATELAGLTSLNLTRLQTILMFSPGGLNPSLADRRDFFDDVYSGAGGAQTRAKLLALWKRSATRAEKLFATGTGSDAVPATLTFEGFLTYQDVELARTSAS